MYETRTYDDKHGQPVVVLVATGGYDVSRLVHALNSGTCEQIGLARQVTRQVRRHNGGRAALRLLAQHGGPFLLTPLVERLPSLDTTAEENSELAHHDAFRDRNHPDGTGDAFTNNIGTVMSSHLADVHQEQYQEAAASGTLTWRHALLANVYEALAVSEPGALKNDLRRVAAIALQWCRAIDRRTAHTDTKVKADA